MKSFVTKLPHLQQARAELAKRKSLFITYNFHLYTFITIYKYQFTTMFIYIVDLN